MWQLAYFATGAGFFSGTGAALNMLAQLFLTPVGITLEAAAATAALVEEATSATDAPKDSVGLVVSNDSEVSSFFAVSQAGDSSVGTETSFSLLRVPFVCVTAAPRPRPPRPRSVPRPRPPRADSAPPLAPLETLVVLVDSPRVVVMVSFALDRERSFLAFDTSPHCVIDPTLVRLVNHIQLELSL